MKKKLDFLEDIDELLRRADELNENSGMYRQRIRENEKQYHDLLDAIERRRKRRKVGGDEDEKVDNDELDELMRLAKNMIGNKGMMQQRLDDIDKQKLDLLERLKSRQRRRKREL